MPPLKVQEEEAIKEEKQEEVAKLVKEEKEEESCPRKEVSSSGSTHFTLRSFSTGSNPPSTQPLPHGPCLPPSSPHPGFHFFKLNSLARCLPPTGLFVEAAICGELLFLYGLPTS